MNPLWKWLTLRVAPEFIDRIDKAVERRRTGTLPLPTRAQAIREALDEWLRRQAA